MASKFLQPIPGISLATKDRSRNNWHISRPLTLPSPQRGEGTSDSYFSNDPKYLRMTLLYGVCGLLGIWGPYAVAATQAEQSFPYTAYVITADTLVRSGPGQLHYPTDKLPVGFAVQVYRHDLQELRQKSANSPHPGETWCAIRPPQGSLSWVESRQVRKLAGGMAENLSERTAVHTGSRLSGRHGAVQVLLTRGELVKLANSGVSADGQWLAIEPPAGEFRWVQASRLSRQPLQEAQPLVAGSSKPTPQSPWKSQLEARAARQARKENKQAIADASQTVATLRASTLQAQPATMAATPKTFNLTPDEPIQIIAGSPAARLMVQSQQQSSPAPPAASAAASADLPSDSNPPSYPTSSPRVHFRNQAGSSVDLPETAAVGQQTMAQHLHPQSNAESSANAAASTLSQSDRLRELQVRLSQMVVQDPRQWQFEQIRSEAGTLLAQAETASLREKLRDLLDQATLFERIRSRKLEPEMALAGNSQPQTVRKASEELATGASVNGNSLYQQRQLDIRQRAQADLTTGLVRRSWRPGSRLETNPVAALEEAPDTVRYDAVGMLKPVVSRRNQSPHYALVDDDGKVVSFVTPAPDVNLKPYIGRRIGVNGTRGFMPEYRRAHVTASRITPLMR